MGTWVVCLLLLAPDWTAADASARRDAVRALTWPAAAEHVPVLIEMRLDDDAGVREAAAAKLHEFGRAALADYLRFLSDPNDAARVVMRDRLSTALDLGAAISEGFLAAPLAAPGAHVRRAGAALIVAYPDPQHRPCDALLDVLHAALADPDAGVRSMAADALAIEGWLSIAGQLPLRDCAPLLALLGDKQEEVQFAAATLLVRLRPANSPERQLLRDKAKSIDPPPGIDMALLLVEPDEAPSPEGIKQIERALAKPDAADLPFALDRARVMGAAAKPLEKDIRALFEQSSGALALAAGEALLAISPENGPVVARKLARLLGPDVDPVLRGRAALALADAEAPVVARVLRLEEPPPVDAPLAEQCAEEDELFLVVLRTKRIAAAGLARADGVSKRTREDLARLANHEDPRLRYLAAVALRRASRE